MKTTKIINKVLEELKSENPKLDYIRGLLEGLVEEVEYSVPATIYPTGKFIVSNKDPVNSSTSVVDEGTILDSTAKANIDRIKSIAEASQQ